MKSEISQMRGPHYVIAIVLAQAKPLCGNTNQNRKIMLKADLCQGEM